MGGEGDTVVAVPAANDNHRGENAGFTNGNDHVSATVGIKVLQGIIHDGFCINQLKSSLTNTD